VTTLSLALTGDTILQRRVSVTTDPPFLNAVSLLRSADVGLTNLEGCIQDREDWHALIAGNGRGATYVRTPSWAGEELRWMGMHLVSLVNNHAGDFGESGFLTTRHHANAWQGMVAAGIGETLAEASAPVYLETDSGLVGFVAAADWGPRGLGDLSFPPPIGFLAADADRYFRGRPGANLLRFECEFLVPDRIIDELRTLSAEMGWEEAKAMRRNGGGRAEPLTGPSDESEIDVEGEVCFMGRRFIAAAEGHSFRTRANPADIDRIVRSIQEARRQADWVVVSLHQHGAARSSEEAPDHVVELGQLALRSGADVFAVHGAGRVGGIELIGSGVAVYGLGTWVQHLDHVRHQPQEMHSRFGLGLQSEVGELLAKRSETEKTSRMSIEEGRRPPGIAGRISSLTMLELQTGKPPVVTVHPIDSRGKQSPRTLTGMPSLVDPETEAGVTILSTIDKRSEPFGTRVNAAGVVRTVETPGTARGEATQ
jgi:poly-gamma-glutamate capsule biosynthesis protein CapA/YwtB (metallophosphatase superfamily)